MDVILVQYADNSNPIFGIDFSVEIPVLPHGTRPFWQPQDGVVHRSRRLDLVADKMQQLNHGRFGVELSRATETFHNWLQAIVFEEGVTALLETDRYSLHVIVARCFPAASVLTRICTYTRDCLYPGDSIHFVDNGKIRLVGVDDQHETKNEPAGPSN